MIHGWQIWRYSALKSKKWKNKTIYRCGNPYFSRQNPTKTGLLKNCNSWILTFWRGKMCTNLGTNNTPKQTNGTTHIRLSLEPTFIVLIIWNWKGLDRKIFLFGTIIIFRFTQNLPLLKVKGSFSTNCILVIHSIARVF